MKKVIGKVSHNYVVSYLSGNMGGMRKIYGLAQLILTCLVW